MEKGNHQVLGNDLIAMNSYWLGLIGFMCTTLSNLDMKETVHFLKHTHNEDDDNFDDSMRVVEEFCLSHGRIINEGYPLRIITAWFVNYCHVWHKNNTDIQKQVKKDKIEELKREIKELKNN